MATGREYLQSILASVAKLQNMSDEALDSVSDGLARMDDEFTECLLYLEPLKE
jgi:hypothetical protein